MAKMTGYCNLSQAIITGVSPCNQHQCHENLWCECSNTCLLSSLQMEGPASPIILVASVTSSLAVVFTFLQMVSDWAWQCNAGCDVMWCGDVVALCCHVFLPSNVAIIWVEEQ